MDKKNGVSVTDAQRKAFSELVDHKYDRLIDEARDMEGAKTQAITEQVAHELGIDVLESQIQALGKQAEILQEKKRKLGFREYGGFVSHSKAGQLIQARAKQRSKLVEQLETERLAHRANIWGAYSVHEIKLIVKHLPEPKTLKQLMAPAADIHETKKRRPTPN